MSVTTLSSKFQISVPKEVREACNWQPGQKLAFIQKNGGVTLVPVASAKGLRGLLNNVDPKKLEQFRDRDDRY